MKPTLSLITILAVLGLTSGCATVKDISSSSETGLTGRSVNADVRNGSEDLSAGNFETPADLQAGNVLGAGELSGKGYRIDDKVVADGLNYYFVIHSDFGDVDAYGLHDLRQRLAEIPAIAELSKYSTAKEFAKGTINSVVDPFRGAAHLVTNPKASAKAAGDGLKSIFASDTSQQEEITDASTSDEVESAKEFAGGYADDYMGYSDAKRKLAAKLKVDPYSRNPLLQHQLKRVASAQTTGSLASFAVPSLLVVDILGTADSLVWQKDEGEAREAGYKTLRSIGVSGDIAKKLLKNDKYTLTEVTAFTLGLKELKGLTGVQQAAERAAVAKYESGASMQAQVPLMLKQYASSIRPLKALTTDADFIGAYTSDGTLVIPLPMDYLMWVREVAQYFRKTTETLKDEKKASIREVYIKGTVSERAKAELVHLGWKVTTLNER